MLSLAAVSCSRVDNYFQYFLAGITQKGSYCKNKPAIMSGIKKFLEIGNLLSFETAQKVN